MDLKGRNFLKLLDFTLEEIDSIARMSVSIGDGELSEDDLTDVAGGIVVDVICVVAGGIALGANIMAEVNKARKAKGKKTIW